MEGVCVLARHAIVGRPHCAVGVPGLLSDSVKQFEEMLQLRHSASFSVSLIYAGRPVNNVEVLDFFAAVEANLFVTDGLHADSPGRPLEAVASFNGTQALGAPYLCLCQRRKGRQEALGRYSG